MSRKQRKNYTPKEKVSILKRHLLEKVPISDLCDQYDLHATVFHRWMKECFENAALAFEKEKDTRSLKLEKKMAELMKEHVKLKKTLGEI